MITLDLIPTATDRANTATWISIITAVSAGLGAWFLLCSKVLDRIEDWRQRNRAEREQWRREEALYELNLRGASQIGSPWPIYTHDPAVILPFQRGRQS